MQIICLRFTLVGFGINYQNRILSKQTNIGIRFYSSNVQLALGFSSRPRSSSILYQGQRIEKHNLSLSYASTTTTTMNPWFFTGFTDGEGCFFVTISKDSKRNTGWKVQPSFSIELSKKDLILLHRIQSFFSVGTIRIHKRDGHGIYSVDGLHNLINVIIPHYDEYPLLTKKRADYLLFKQVIAIMKNKEHLTIRRIN